MPFIPTTPYVVTLNGFTNDGIAISEDMTVNEVVLVGIHPQTDEDETAPFVDLTFHEINRSAPGPGNFTRVRTNVRTFSQATVSPYLSAAVSTLNPGDPLLVAVRRQLYQLLVDQSLIPAGTYTPP